jgi:4-diphosphocytidyl-2-C-methyl-D-erythritol kinase
LDKISLKVPAKINLYLRVLGKRDDGYHEIESLMQAVDIYDEITLERSDAIEITCDDPSLSRDESNLAFKAAAVLQDRFYFPGVKIDLAKRIPSGAGLGGGSADAAFVIRGLCSLYGLAPEPDEILEIAADIGSDVPFFLSGGQAQVSGRGEIVRSIRLPDQYEIIVIVPPITTSTAEIYNDIRFDLTKDRDPILLEKKISVSRLSSLVKRFSNDLEEAVLSKFPELAELKETLMESGAVWCSMTGSGSAFFGLFLQADNKALDIRKRLSPEYKVFYCRPILLRPLWT